jgi:hypothetical protein
MTKVRVEGSGEAGREQEERKNKEKNKRLPQREQRGRRGRREEMKEGFLTSRTPLEMTVGLHGLPRWGRAMLDPYKKCGAH